MPRSQRRSLIILVAALVWTPSLLRTEASQPNVLFFAIDDLRPELGCYGHPIIQSPNIDRLAANGMLFENAYCQQAVCAPSRISLLTGLRPDTTGIYDLTHPLRKTKPGVRSMPQHFKEAGYETVSLGKIYHHSQDDNGVGWTRDAWRPRGGWEGRGYVTAEAIARIKPVAEAKGKPGIGPAYEAGEVDDGAYPDGTTAAQALAELRRLSQGQRPFFLAVGFSKPHLPFNAPRKYWDRYNRTSILPSKLVDWPKMMPSMASTRWGELRQYVGIPSNGPLTRDDAITLIHGYYACVSYVDAQVGRVLEELERLDLRGNTVIALWGDHGWKLGEYGAWCKHTNFELDAHVPMILSVPKQATAGVRTKALVEFVDLFPTLADLCGIGVPPACEGTSMTPLLDDPHRSWKKAAFSQYPRGKTMGYSLRTGPWRYTEWIDRKSGEVEARELYDHRNGPVATKNLATDPAQADTVKRLSELLNGGQGWREIQEPL